MKTPTHTQSVSSKTLPTKLGPGEYRPAGIFQRVEDLPKPKIIKQQRDMVSQPCPQCGQPASRHRSFSRRLHDLGDLFSGRPCILEVTYSQHYCSACQKYFNLDLSDLAAPKSLYTHRVQDLAVRLVIEDSLPYRTASWHTCPTGGLRCGSVARPPCVCPFRYHPELGGGRGEKGLVTR